MKEELNELSKEVIGAAIEVHRELGPGLLETSYEACLHHELGIRGISAKRQLLLPIQYKSLKVPDAYRIDLLVEESIVLELKTVSKLLPVHSAQLLTYLRMSEKSLGLLMNFQAVRLTDEIKRLVHNFPN